MADKLPYKREQKDEALQHLDVIKSVLVDKDAFFPYNYNALIVWGVIGMIMTLFVAVLLKYSILVGTIFSLIMMSIGFVIEGFLVKQVNQKYDIDDCTKRQKFISTIFTMLTLASISLSALLAKYELIPLSYIVWIFCCSIGYYAIGFILNLPIFTKSAYIKFSASLLLIIVSYFISDLSSINSPFFYLVGMVTFVLLGVLPIYMGQKLKKEL